MDNMNRIYNIIFIILIISSLILAAFNFTKTEFFPKADEGYYYKYSVYISENGFSGFRKLFNDYIDNPGEWVYPSPIRAGLISIEAVWLRFTRHSMVNLAVLSYISFVLLLAVSYYFTRKFFGQNTALLFTALAAASPLDMALARRALSDAAGNLFIITSIWLFYIYAKSRANLARYLFIPVFSIAILARELNVLFIGFFVIYAVYDSWVRRSKFALRDFLITLIAPVLLALSVYLYISAGPGNLIRLIQIIIFGPLSAEYALKFGSGPWFRYLVDFLLLSPVVFILAVAYFIKHIWGKDCDKTATYLIIMTAVMLFSLSFFTKNARYAMFLNLPLRLFAVLMLKEIFDARFAGKALFLTNLSVILLVLADNFIFVRLFLINHIYDPVSYYLLRAWQIIP